MHTLAQPHPGVILSITSAIKPRPKHINALWGLLKDTNPGLSRSIRDHSTGFWFSGMKLTGADFNEEE